MITSNRLLFRDNRMPPRTAGYRRMPLLRLPGELLNKIYRLVLVSPTPFISYTLSVPVEEHNQYGDLLLGSQRTSAYPELPGLLLTCSKVFREASPIFWAENTFVFNLGRERLAETGHVSKWLKRQRDFKLTSIKLHFSLDYNYGSKALPSRAASLHISCERLEQPYFEVGNLAAFPVLHHWDVDLTPGGALAHQCTCVLQRDLRLIASIAGAASAADEFELRYLPSLDIRATEGYRSWPQFEERCAICEKPKKEGMRGKYYWVAEEDVPVRAEES